MKQWDCEESCKFKQSCVLYGRASSRKDTQALHNICCSKSPACFQWQWDTISTGWALLQESRYLYAMPKLLHPVPVWFLQTRVLMGQALGETLTTCLESCPSLAREDCEGPSHQHCQMFDPSWASSHFHSTSSIGFGCVSLSREEWGNVDRRVMWATLRSEKFGRMSIIFIYNHISSWCYRSSHAALKLFLF